MEQFLFGFSVQIIGDTRDEESLEREFDRVNRNTWELEKFQGLVLAHVSFSARDNWSL